MGSNQIKMTRARKIALFSLIGAIMLLFSTVFFLHVARWLIVSDPVPDSLDVIFTFAGEKIRVDYSQELMKRFPEAIWVLSDYRNGYARLLRNNNYDMSRVRVIDTCKSTRSEVNALAERVTGKIIIPGADSTLSIGLVSSPYHMRRIQMMIKRRFGNYDGRIYYLPVPLQQYKWTQEMINNWWRSAAVSRKVFSELQKIVYYFLVS